MNLESFCHTRGEALIEGIAPALNGFFNRISADPPGIWNCFACAVAASLIRDELARFDVLDREPVTEGEFSGRVLRAFFLCCSHAWAHAVHESAEVCRATGIGGEPVVN